MDESDNSRPAAPRQRFTCDRVLFSVPHAGGFFALFLGRDSKHPTAAPRQLLGRIYMSTHEKYRVAFAQILPPGAEGVDIGFELFSIAKHKQEQKRARDARDDAHPLVRAVLAWTLAPCDANFTPLNVQQGVSLDVVLAAVGTPFSHAARIRATYALKQAGWEAHRRKAQRLWRPRREVRRGTLRLVASR